MILIKIAGPVHIFCWFSTYVQIFRLFHAVVKISIGGTKLHPKTDGQSDFNKPPYTWFAGVLKH